MSERELQLRGAEAVLSDAELYLACSHKAGTAEVVDECDLLEQLAVKIAEQRRAEAN